MGLVALIQGAFRRADARSDGGEDGMARVRAGGGASSSGPGGGGGRGGPAAHAAADEAKLPRGMRETAALLRANGYGVLNEEKLRHPHRADGGAAAPQQQQQQQQQQRQVRLVEPEPAAERRRTAADKRKQRDASSSEDERPARSGGAARSTQPQPAPSQGLKRVRSSWKIRPLLVDEKLPVFLEGYDTSLLHYDGGEFHQWLLDCQSGAADPADGFPYPLVVQDRDLRTLLEIKPPGEGGMPGGELAVALPVAEAAAAGGEGIIVPTVRLLPDAEQPDNLVREQEPPVVQRMQDVEQPDVIGASAAAQAASAAWRSAERAVALDPPYIRYVQPTPDDLDLAVEYDLDEDDEEWLEQFNAEAKRAKSRKGRRTLGEEWMEHLIDRMEKEYTAELQRHPGKWVMQAADPGGTEPPAISIPSIEEVFPVEKCLQVPGINHYENVIEAVYHYWKAKHERAGRPLIQRLWYEPPWDRKKAAQRLASSAADGEGGASEGGPFYAQDSPAALAGIRKRRMDPEEVKARFQEMRRDLEAARTLADQVRKREKLKRRELQLYKEEWAARMQAIRDGTQRVVLKSGRVKDPPAQLSAVWRMEAYAAEMGPEFSDDASDEHIAVGAPQDAAAQAEERAARLAQRRYAREVALAPRGQKRPGRPPAMQPQRKPDRPRSAQGRPAPARAAAASPILYQGGNVRGPPAGRGIKRVPRCVWCHSDEYHLLGCASCYRCFCFKCFQRRPGLGINNWSRAVKDSSYQCVICRGLEAEDAPSANTADQLPAEDAADATSPPRAQQRSRQQQRRSQQTVGDKKVPNNRAEAEAMGIEVPPGLGGAALRSFLRRQWLEEEAEEGGSSAEEPPVQQQSRRQQQEQQEEQAAARRRPQQQQQQPSHRQMIGDKQVPNNRAEAEAMGIEVPRGLGGAALRSFLRRQWLEEEEEDADAEESSEEEAEGEEEEAQQQPQLPRRRQHEQQQQQQQQQQAGQRRSQQLPQQPLQRQTIGDKQVPNNRAEAEAMGIEVPRGLGGAALRSFLRRQWLEEEESSSDEEGRVPQPGALPSNRAEAEAMGMELPPGLGGAALRSFLLRQQREREEEEGGSGSSKAQGSEEEPRPARHAAPARRRGSSSEGDAEAEPQRLRQRKGGKQRQAEPEPSSSSSEDEEEWPYAFPPPPRKLGGAALRSYIKRQEQLLEEEQEGQQLSGSSSGTALGAGSGGESDAATSGQGASSDEERSELKENRAPPAKRARKAAGGGPHSRKSAAAAGPAAGRRPAAGGRRLQQQNQNRRWSARHA